MDNSPASKGDSESPNDPSPPTDPPFLPVEEEEEEEEEDEEEGEEEEEKEEEEEEEEEVEEEGVRVVDPIEEQEEPGSKSSSASQTSSRSGVPRSSSASSPALISASGPAPSSSAHKRVRQMIRDPMRKISLPDKALPFLRRTTPTEPPSSAPASTTTAPVSAADAAPRRKLGVFSRPPVFNGLFQRNATEPPPNSPPADSTGSQSSPGPDECSPRHKAPGSTFARIFSKPIQRSRSAGSSEAPAHALFLRQGQKSKAAAASGSVGSCTNGGGASGGSPKSSEICVYEGEKTERKKKRSIGQDVRQRLSLFRRQAAGSGAMPCRHTTDTERILKASLPDEEAVRRWSDSFDALLQDKYGLALFHSFLKTEFSEENIEFWIACEEYKNISTTRKLHSRAQKIYNDYIAVQAPQEVNLDSNTRVQTIRAINTPSRHTFDQAQKRIQALMDKDSYQRFLRSDIYVALVREVTEAAAAAATSSNNNNNNESSTTKNISTSESPSQISPSSSFPNLPVEGDSTA